MSYREKEGHHGKNPVERYRLEQRLAKQGTCQHPEGKKIGNRNKDWAPIMFCPVCLLQWVPVDQHNQQIEGIKKGR